MMGPGYTGHMLVSLHNGTDKVIALKVGSTFVSVTFCYLKTKTPRTSATISGHVDKFCDLGLQLDESKREELTQDWKCTVVGIKDKMLETTTYKDLAKKRRRIN